MFCRKFVIFVFVGLLATVRAQDEIAPKRGLLQRRNIGNIARPNPLNKAVTSTTTTEAPLEEVSKFFHSTTLLENFSTKRPQMRKCESFFPLKFFPFTKLRTMEEVGVT